MARNFLEFIAFEDKGIFEQSVKDESKTNIRLFFIEK